MKFTLEIYKMDRRTKEGQRLVGKYDYDRADKAAMEREIAALFPTYRKRDGYIFNVVETYREVTNMMTGKTILERYDTPFACSVGSESYWSA
jgi:nitric oxide reductase activation protein